MIALMVLLVNDLAAMFRVAPVTIYRWHAGGKIPRSISTSGTLRWLASDIEAFLQSQSNTAPPVKVPTAKQRKKQEREYKERQQRAAATLDRHRTVKGGKSK